MEDLVTLFTKNFVRKKIRNWSPKFFPAEIFSAEIMKNVAEIFSAETFSAEIFGFLSSRLMKTSTFYMTGGGGEGLWVGPLGYTPMVTPFFQFSILFTHRKPICTGVPLKKQFSVSFIFKRIKISVKFFRTTFSPIFFRRNFFLPIFFRRIFFHRNS